MLMGAQDSRTFDNRQSYAAPGGVTISMQARTALNTAQATSVSEMVHDYVREGILSGSLLAGQALKQDEIASQLSVSRAPVREALNQLEGEGLVLLRPRRGYVVASLDVEEIEEIFQIRMLLEEHAARIATQRRTLVDISAVRNLLRAMDESGMDSPASIAKWSALNREFHATIYRASRVNRLCQITENLRDTVEQYVRLDAAMADRIGEAQKEHKLIVQAFEAGDADRTAQLSREHCQHTCDRLIASLRRRRASLQVSGEKK
jgi:DNA-binding GntR family transcriptional regulator